MLHKPAVLQPPEATGIRRQTSGKSPIPVRRETIVKTKNRQTKARPVKARPTKRQPAKARQTKVLCLLCGLLLWSAASRCLAYGILMPAAKGTPINFPAALLCACLYLSGGALLLAALFAVHPVRPWKRCRKRLAYLAAGYLGIQLLLSLAAGALTWCLGSFAGLSQETVKTGADLLCRLLQIPVRGTAMVLALQILAGFREKSRAVFLKAMAAEALGTLCRHLLTLGQGGIPVQAAGILLSAAITGALWAYVYRTCQKEAAAALAVPAVPQPQRLSKIKQTKQ